ncbi:MAG: Holliday junction resolvase RuvX, partial [Deltaproteobacteria bacterium]|nr:Holliday junction resolvase RuvX [Deltaproteobacteria bacterium]
MSNIVKWLCLDYGEKRVGVAVARVEPAEEGGAAPLAFPRPAILRTTRQALFERLLALLEEEKPGAILLGLPLRRDGSDSLTTRQVRNFAASLRRRCGLPLYFMDETLSSAEAE